MPFWQDYKWTHFPYIQSQRVYLPSCEWVLTIGKMSRTSYVSHTVVTRETSPLPSTLARLHASVPFHLPKQKAKKKNASKLHGQLTSRQTFIRNFMWCWESFDTGSLSSITGGSLQEHIENYRHLNMNTSLQYFRQILQALVYLQQKYVLHEDIKADNILLRANSMDLVLVDFGLSRQLPPDNPFVPAGQFSNFLFAAKCTNLILIRKEFCVKMIPRKRDLDWDNGGKVGWLWSNGSRFLSLYRTSFYSVCCVRKLFEVAGISLVSCLKI